MGFSDPLTPRAPKPKVSLQQLCYDIAYFLFPPNAFENLAQTLELFREDSDAGVTLYLMACRNRGVEPVQADAGRFALHHGVFAPGREYFALEYPVPPPIDMLKGPSSDSLVLAPHFSALLHDVTTDEVEYFVLGQAPFDGGTTLRCVLREGANCNLGPGPEPHLAAFLDAVRGHNERRARRT